MVLIVGLSCFDVKQKKKVFLWKVFWNQKRSTIYVSGSFIKTFWKIKNSLVPINKKNELKIKECASNLICELFSSQSSCWMNKN